MTKADIVVLLFVQLKLSKKEATDTLELILETMKTSLEKGDRVKISGFGNFVLREKKSRLGRNPQTGDQLTIAARKVLSFRPSQVLKASLNNPNPRGGRS